MALARKTAPRFSAFSVGQSQHGSQIAYVLFAVGFKAGITPLIVATVLGWIAAALTLWSGIDYFIKMSRRVS